MGRRFGNGKGFYVLWHYSKVNGKVFWKETSGLDLRPLKAWYGMVMIGYGLDMGGPKDSETALNAFLTKTNGKGFWRFVTELYINIHLFDANLFSIVGDLTDMRWTRWSRRYARRVNPDPALSFVDPSRKRWRQSRGRWDSTPSNCSRLAQRGWGSPPPPPWMQQNTFTLQGTSRIQGNSQLRPSGPVARSSSMG